VNRRRGPRFAQLLILIITVYVVVIGFGSTRLGGLAQVALLGLVLMAALRIQGLAGRRTTLSVSAAVFALVAATIAAGLGSRRLSVALVSAAVITLVIAAAAVILMQLWHRAVVDAHTLAGALSVYLLLAQLFASLHQLLAALHGLPYLNGVPTLVDGATYLYFSVITLATVGYGDVTPACDAARAVAMSEALVGQLYLVAVVGTVVGNVTTISRRRPDSPVRDEAETASRG
jgi:Ion channel